MTMMGYMQLGIRFDPTDEELVFSYLERKVLGEPLPSVCVSDCDDLYSDKNPWELFDKDFEYPFYVFTRLKKKKDTHTNVIRTAGSGTWKGQNTESFRDSRGIWFKKDFVFELNKKNIKDGSDLSSKQNGHWLMTEFSLEDQGVNTFVLCRIYNKDACTREKKKKKDEVITFQQPEYPFIVNDSRASHLTITTYPPGSKRGLSDEHEAQEDLIAKRMRVCCHPPCQESFLKTDNGDTFHNSTFLPSNLVAEHVGVSSLLQDSVTSFMIPGSDVVAPPWTEYQESYLETGNGDAFYNSTNLAVGYVNGVSISQLEAVNCDLSATTFMIPGSDVVAAPCTKYQESNLETGIGDAFSKSTNLAAEYVNGVSSSLQETANCDLSAPPFMIPGSGALAAPWTEYQKSSLETGNGGAPCNSRNLAEEYINGVSSSLEEAVNCDLSAPPFKTASSGVVAAPWTEYQESFLETGNGDSICNATNLDEEYVNGVLSNGDRICNSTNLDEEYVNGVSSSLVEAVNCDLSAAPFMTPSSGIQKSPFLLSPKQPSVSVTSHITSEHALQESLVYLMSTETDPKAKAFHNLRVSELWNQVFPPPPPPRNDRTSHYEEGFIYYDSLFDYLWN